MKQQKHNYRQTDHHLDDMNDYLDNYGYDDAYVSDFNETRYGYGEFPGKGLTRKQARRYSARKMRSRNRPRYFD